MREVERRLRVADRLAACLADPRAPDQITHSLADIIRFRLLMIGAGYEDGNDASGLRGDPMFKMALDLSPSDRDLCSQSTISRLENLPDVRALLRMGRAMVDLYCASFARVPKRITLDIDDTFDAVHGGQQLRRLCHAGVSLFNLRKRGSPMGMTKISYSGYRFPPEIIHQAIWLYLRFTFKQRGALWRMTARHSHRKWGDETPRWSGRADQPGDRL